MPGLDVGNPKQWYTAEKRNGIWCVYCIKCRHIKPVWNDEGTGLAGDMPEHCNPVCQECAVPTTSQGAQLRTLFDALHQAMIKYSPPIYPVDLALVTLKEALDQIP